jgi:hypothetical protein
MDDLEHIRMCMTYESLKQITDDFSTQIGSGTLGAVYKVSIAVYCTSTKIRDLLKFRCLKSLQE